MFSTRSLLFSSSRGDKCNICFLTLRFWMMGVKGLRVIRRWGLVHGLFFLVWVSRSRGGVHLDLFVFCGRWKNYLKLLKFTWMVYYGAELVCCVIAKTCFFFAPVRISSLLASTMISLSDSSFFSDTDPYNLLVYCFFEKFSDSNIERNFELSVLSCHSKTLDYFFHFKKAQTHYPVADTADLSDWFFVFADFLPMTYWQDVALSGAKFPSDIQIHPQFQLIPNLLFLD